MQLPAPAGYTVRMWFTPQPNALVAGTDAVALGLDGFGWATSYIATDMAVNALRSEESEDAASAWERRKAALVRRIESEAANRNAADAQRAPNKGYGDGAWWDTDSSGGGW